MIILGIDPGTINTGYSIIKKISSSKPSLIEAGFIKMKNKILEEQIKEINLNLDILFKKHKIDVVAMEDIFYAFNPKTVLKLAQFRGAISLKILQNFDNFFEYTPLQVKRSITGNGKADKNQVSFIVKKLLNIKGEIKPLDITDAMAVALTHFLKSKSY